MKGWVDLVGSPPVNGSSPADSDNWIVSQQSTVSILFSVILIYNKHDHDVSEIKCISYQFESSPV